MIHLSILHGTAPAGNDVVGGVEEGGCVEGEAAGEDESEEGLMIVRMAVMICVVAVLWVVKFVEDYSKYAQSDIIISI